MERKQEQVGIAGRITSRDILAVIFASGYFVFLFYAAERGLKELDDIMYILLGILSSALILIVQFYFRKTPCSEKKNQLDH